MSHRFQSQSAVLCCCLMLGFAGCGGDDATEVAQNPAPTTPAAVTNSGSDSNSSEAGGYEGGESYGGESYGGESYGGESSGESGGYDGGYSGGYDGGGEDESEGMGGYDGGYDGGYGDEGEDEGMGYDGGYGGGGPSMASAGGGGYGDGGYDGGYGDEGDGYDGGYGGGGPGMGAPALGGPGMGMGGMSPQPPTITYAAVNQFMLQNCSMCHMRGQTKGGVSLAAVTSDVSDSSDVWESVASVLESGSMPPRGRRQPAEQQKKAIAEWIRTELAESQEAMKDLLATAKRKFGSGKEDEGIEYLYAHFVSSDPEATNELLSDVGFYMRGRRPVTALRFAAAVVIDVPDTMTDVKPIGSSQFGGAGGGGYGGGGYGDGPGRRRNGQAESQRTFESLTGEYGERVVSEFKSHWAEGKFGSLFSDVASATPQTAPASASAGGYGGGMYGDGYGGEGDEGYGGPGMGAPALGGPGMGAPALGDPGMGAPALGGPGMGMGMGGPGMAAGGEARVKTNTLPGHSLAVGLTYLGDGDRKEILERFAESGADVLILFDIDAKTNNRTRIVTNKTTVRVVDSAGETVGASRQLVNTEVEKNRLREKDDGLDSNIERLFGLLDSKVNVIPMPSSMAAQHAQARMASILSDESVTPLRKMFEARLYNSMGLLTTEELSMVYQIVLDGNEGVSLAAGSNEDRQFVIQSKLETLMAL